MKMYWVGVTVAQYDAVKRETRFAEDAPKGAKYHVAWFTPSGLHVVDVWERPEDFQHYLHDRFMPAVRRVGILGQPQVELHAAHNAFALAT